MVTKKYRYAGVVEKIEASAKEIKFDIARISVLVVKNKIGRIRRKGKALIEKHIKPLVQPAEFPTGSAAPAEGTPSYPLQNFPQAAQRQLKVLRPILWPILIGRLLRKP